MINIMYNELIDNDKFGYYDIVIFLFENKKTKIK